ncbi:MAG: hypothetical protein H8D45_18845 [Bacteroidetes bacterium]|nr:hypothetical protein [Bacteroidota bacterium]
MKIGLGLFVYNRPHHTKQVLEGLKRNNIDKLYIFCDGPKPGEDTENIDQTRDLVKSIDWCDTKIVMQEYNLGLVANTVSGIYTMLEENDAAVVLEDDCVPRSDFWYYMSTCLRNYQHSDKVMHVNGYQLPIKIRRSSRYDVFFTALPQSWGCGVWKRSWQYFRMDISDAADYFKRPESTRLTSLCPLIEDGIQRVIRGDISSWVYRWYYLINLNKGFCVAPYKSLIRNIGHDGTGVHCGESNIYNIDDTEWNKELFTNKKLKLPEKIFRDKYMDAQTPHFYGKIRRVDRVKDRLKAMFWRPLPEYFKATIRRFW